MPLYLVNKNGEVIKKLNFKPTTKGNKNPKEIFYESTQKLFKLLIHHPHFIKGVAILRDKYKLSYQEITNISKLLQWKNANNKKCNLIAQDEDLYGLINDFKIPQELKKSAKNFAYDFILTNNLITNNMFETGLNIIKHSLKEKTLKLNPNSVYVEITPFTTEREIKNTWEKIVGKRKEIRNYGIPKTSKIDERVWELSMDGYKIDEIIKKIKEEFDRKSFIYSDVNTSKNKYKTALSKLRKI
jgi:hypothetical protein